MFFLFLVTVVKSPGQSDTYMFHHEIYTTDDGLSSRFIQDIYQDSRGFIWVSSDYGINRFDGQKFEVYNQGKYKLQTDNINEVREDQAGNLWLINRDFYFRNGVKAWRKVSVDILNYYENTIVPIEEYLKEAPPFKWSSVLQIEQDKSFNLWITTKEGKVYRYTDHFTEISIEPDLIKGGVLYSLSDSGFLILATNHIIKLNERLEFVYKVDFKIRLGKVVSTENGQIFLVTDSERIVYELDNQAHIKLFKRESLASEQGLMVHRFGTDAQGRIWIEGEEDSQITVYQNGSSVLDADLNRFVVEESVNNRFDFFGDQSGGIWYSDRNGLNYISLNKPGFKSYFRETDISLREIFEISDSTLFINTYRGYYELNKYTGYYEVFELPGHYGYSQGGLLLNGFIYNSLYEDKIAKIDIKQHTIDYIPMNAPNQRPKTFTLAPDKRTALIGCSGGLFVLDTELDTIFPFKKYNEFKALENTIVNSFKQVDGACYLQTANGMYILDWEKGIVGHHNFVFNHLLDLYVDENGVFWIATRGGGLLEWDRANDIVQQYTVDDGLSHNIIYAVYGDPLNQLWLPSNKGLMRFNKKDKTLVTFLKGNGMKDNEFNQYAHYQDKEGTLFMGGVNGLIGFQPKDLSSLEKTNLNSKIVATKITVSRDDNKTYDLAINTVNAVNAGETLVVKGDVQSTNIEISLLNYDRLKLSQYSYKIEGIHDIWQPMKDQYIRLTGLPGGTHKLLIKVYAGIKMKTYYGTITVQILKPFTHTWIFFSLCALGFLALGISLSRYRIYRLDQINRRLEQKVKSRTQKIEDDKILISQQYQEMERINKTKDHLIAIIGHDLKDYVSTFEGIEQKINYLISSEQVERIPHLAEFIENSAHDLSLLLDNLLNWALKERGDLLLHPDSVKVQSILGDVLIRLEKSIAKKEIKLVSEIPEELSIYVDGLTLHSLLRNMIHNAIKFSHRQGVVKIYHTEEDGFVGLHIQDQGIGMPSEQIETLLTDTNAVISTRGTENEAGTGMGLLLCREMLEMQSGKFKVVSTVGEGTTFSIVLPKQIMMNNLEEIGV